MRVTEMGHICKNSTPTRMHTSRMHTVCCRSHLLKEGDCPGVSVQEVSGQGVPGQRGCLARGVFAWWSVCLGGICQRGVYPEEGVCLGRGCLARGVSAGEGVCPGGVSGQGGVWPGDVWPGGCLPDTLCK